MKALLKALLLGALTLLPSAFAQCSAPYLVEQQFPVSGPELTRWRVCWQVHPTNGLIITSAYFRTSPSSRWIQVLSDARVSEIFVPYHDDSERYYDMSTVQDLADVGNDDCPAGTRLQSDPEQPTDICQEVRDRGIAWKEGPAVHRGQELVLWGALIAGNYNYILEWTFRDDGTFIGRVGATAANLPTNPMMPHMHDAVWRINVDLDGQNNSVALVQHQEMGDFASDTATPIPAACGMEWNQYGFSFLDISNAELTNGRTPPDPTTYMLMPLVWGTGRHTESFTQDDFWVTDNNPAQMSARYLPKYVTGQNVANTDVAIWYKGSLHHMPRDEDGQTVGTSWQGETQVMWTGFVMMPNNLFDQTPFYP